MQEDLPWQIIFHLGLLRFNLGEQTIEWNKSLVAVFRKCSVHAHPFRSTSERSGAHMYHLFIDEIVEN